MATTSEIISLIQGLSEQQLEQLKNYILGKLRLGAEGTEPGMTARHCPHCKGSRVIRFGMKGSKQRYKCKDCGRVFVGTTGTMAYKSKHPPGVWSDYVTCMLGGHPLKHSAEACGIDIKTAFYWRHKILGSVREVIDGSLSLSGEVEADETFFDISYKGNHSRGGFTMPRKPHKRGSSCRTKGISKEKVCVSCMVDSQGSRQAELAGLGRITTGQLEALNRVEPGSTLVTDKATAYQRYAKANGLELVQLKAGKEYRRGIHSLAHVNAFHNGIKRFLIPFNGVSTKHLPNYLHWCIFLIRTAAMIQSHRGALMFDKAVTHHYSITQKQIHAKNPFPVAA